jgi:ribosomal protein S12 methylthiotransferase accessory factor
MADRRRQLRPILSGPGITRDGVLTLQAPAGQLMVRAPRRFLRGLIDWCDGTRGLDALAALATSSWGASSFPDFLDDMLAAGVLIPQQLLSLRTSQRPVDRSSSVPANLLATPFASFGREALTADQLNSFLPFLRLHELGSGWSARHDPALTFTIILREAIGGFQAGVHEVSGDSKTGPLLGYQGPAGSAIYRSMADPLGFARATWLLVVSCELETELMNDRVLAPRTALFNAGVVRHRAGEWARQSGTAWADDLDCAQDTLRQCCNLGSRSLVYVAAFGSQSAGSDHVVPPCTVSWMDDAAYRGLFIARASPPSRGEHAPETVAWGRSYDAADALRKAIGELAERLALRAPATMVEAKATDLGGHADPLALVQYSRRQYADGSLKVKRFDLHDVHWWTEGREWFSGSRVWLPADCVFGRTTLRRQSQSPSLMRPTSSGCASDVCEEAAIERAAYEVIERDALARHWLAQEPAHCIESLSLPARIRHRMEFLGALGCETFVMSMTMGLGPSILVLIRNLHLGFTCAGSASGPDAGASVERAFIEAEFAAITRCKGVTAPKIRPREAALPEDHANLYAQRAYFRRADALIGDAEKAIDFARMQWPSSIRERLTDERPLYWLELPSGESPRQLNGERIKTVRVLIPGCIPLAFGYDALPQGMVSHAVSARARFPHPLA